MVCKEEVVTWFRSQCGALRIDVMCSLLECCLPYELRYVGTILEHLGKRDFHELREVENKANAFATHMNLEDNKKALFNLISDPGGQPNSSSSNAGPHNSSHSNSIVPSNSHDSPTSRPSPTHNSEPKMWPHWNCEGPPLHQSQSASSGSQKSKALAALSGIGGNGSLMNGTSIGSNCGSNNCNSCGIDESDKNEVLSNDLGALSDERKRHRLTLYFSLLRVTNRICSSAFYALLTQVDQTVNCDSWLEGRDENTLEELALLYTMGNNHPAFTFEQRTIVGDTLNRIKGQLQRFKVPKYQNPPPTAYLPAYDPKYCYYVQYVPQQHLQHQVQVPPAPQVGAVVGNLGSGPSPIPTVDISRLPQQMGYTFPQYSQYPMFMPTHSQTHTPPPPPPVIQNHVGKNMATTMNSKPPSLQQSISLDSGWATKKVGKEKGLPTELEQPLQMNDPTSTMSIGRSRKVACFNCGSQSHLGQECKEATIEDITKYFYRLNYSNSSADSS